MNFVNTSNTVLVKRFRDLSTASILYILCTYIIAAVFAVSGIAKLVDSSGLLNTLRQVPFLSGQLIVWTVTLLPLIEIGLAVALITRWKRSITLAAILILFVFFFVFSIYGFYGGFNSDCGCFGPLVQSTFGWGMILRNIIFLSLSVIASMIYYKHLREQG